MKHSGRKTSRRSSAEIRRVVDEFEASNLSRKQYAAFRGIPVSSLDYWLRVARKNKGASVVAVRVEDQARVGSLGSSFEVSLGRDRVIRVPRGFDEADLRRLMRVVAEGC